MSPEPSQAHIQATVVTAFRALYDGELLINLNRVAERGFAVDHSKINRWNLAYAPLIEKRSRRLSKFHCGSVRIGRFRSFNAARRNDKAVRGGAGLRKGLGSAGEWTVRRQNDLDALERNIKKMGDYAKAHGTRHRVHSKMHKSVDVAKLQEKLGGAVGVCCQKVSEAEVFARGGIKDILVSNEVRDPAKIERLAKLAKLGSDIIVSVDDLAKVAELSEVAAQAGLPFEAVELDSMGEADVIISITSAFSPSLMAKHVSEGTHIACMGTDTKGKQEVEAALLAKARVFTNEVAQSITIGEAQHAVAEGLISEADITTIGAVINGTHPGRSADSDITLFDGTGVGLQDLAVAAAVVDLAVEKGIAIEIDF